VKALLFWVAVSVVSACVALLWMVVVGASFLGGMRLVAVFA